MPVKDGEVRSWLTYIYKLMILLWVIKRSIRGIKKKLFKIFGGMRMYAMLLRNIETVFFDFEFWGTYVYIETV